MNIGNNTFLGQNIDTPTNLSNQPKRFININIQNATNIGEFQIPNIVNSNSKLNSEKSKLFEGDFILGTVPEYPPDSSLCC